MDGITYVSHAQTVYLKANKPPPFLQSVRHWNISSTTGIVPAIDPKENAAFIAALPGRIVTVPMLHHLYSHYIVIVLLMVWICAMYCRFFRPRHRVTRLQALGSSCLPMPLIWFAYADWLKSCVVAVAIAAALCGGLPDALGLLAALTSAHEGWTITAITLTVAYVVWVKDFLKDCRLPDFATFSARLQPSPLVPKVSEEDDEDPSCLVCWSSEATLLQLPCHADHKVCRDCLPQLFNANQYRCPFCRKALFIYKSKTYRSCLWYIVTATNALRLTLNLIVLALQLYKGYYGTAVANVFVAALSVALKRYDLRTLIGEGDLANTRLTVLWLTLGTTVYSAWSAIAAVHTWDQITLWDGEVLEGVDVWTTYEVVREWYSAATST
ncbi:hypothetical protein MBLNU13_g11275t1 [Cladosporium sp. NU13]